MYTTKVYNVFEKFNQNGILGLVDELRLGRPRKISAEVSKIMLEILETKASRKVGNYLHGKWTLKLIVDYLEKHWEIKTLYLIFYQLRKPDSILLRVFGNLQRELL